MFRALSRLQVGFARAAGVGSLRGRRALPCAAVREARRRRGRSRVTSLTWLHQSTEVSADLTSLLAGSAGRTLVAGRQAHGGCREGLCRRPPGLRGLLGVVCDTDGLSSVTKSGRALAAMPVPGDRARSPRERPELGGRRIELLPAPPGSLGAGNRPNAGAAPGLAGARSSRSPTTGPPAVAGSTSSPDDRTSGGRPDRPRRRRPRGQG
jgi:hypothetical protein